MKFRLNNPDKRRRRWDMAVWVRNYPFGGHYRSLPGPERYKNAGHYRAFLGSPTTMTDVATLIAYAERVYKK